MSGLVQVNYHRISHFVETKQRHVNLKHKSKNHKIPSWASCEKEAPPPEPGPSKCNMAEFGTELGRKLIETLSMLFCPSHPERVIVCNRPG